MTPKEKAQELFDKFYLKVLNRDGTSAMNRFEVKQCALIAVDEIWHTHKTEIEYKFWKEVKIEIEKQYDSN